MNMFEILPGRKSDLYFVNEFAEGDHGGIAVTMIRKLLDGTAW